ncbi:disulfide bond formation protein DsbA [Duganella sp. Leaf126]|uniref:thiol:disulfide interchange protein DsbA/DsbL n=1 Tax=Duganella sp. Leaf126 TaxID=1736266 RepID=UPI0006F4D86F|nr:thiol:disulfide interchange protein DsbA/DsbL [Duganella sp. Leaf126]KQQ33801.1 disulfide bond formation protein DsbA [Duganella sp. Leaf126]
MRVLKYAVSAMLMSAVVLSASASPADPKNGVEYRTLSTPQQADAKKVEVIEFFDYACPHCYALDPSLQAWVKKQGNNIVFKRVHISRTGTDLPQQKMFYTLESMGLMNDAMNTKIFNEMHVNRNRMNRDELVFDFIAKQGVDRQKFIDTYRGFGVQGHVRKATSMMETYGVDSWPMFAIDGKYVTSPAMSDEGAKSATTEAQLQAQGLQVMDVLVAKAKAEKK